MKSRPVSESTIGSKQSWNTTRIDVCVGVIEGNFQRKRTNHNPTTLTWKIATACESNTLVSREVIFPFKSLHLTSKSVSATKVFSICFFFIMSRELSGSFSAPASSKFCRVEYIHLQFAEQNHFPFGSSCVHVHEELKGWRMLIKC